MTRKHGEGGVQVVRRVAGILRALKDEPGGLSLSQIAARVGLPRSTVHRLVVALEGEQLLAPVSREGGYRLGPALAGLAAVSERGLALAAHPFLVALSRELDETVDLAVRQHDLVLFVDHIDVPRRLRAASSLGALFPAYCTANGKALLAALDDEELAGLLPERLERLTPSTITARSELLAELARVREEGVAYDREEHTLGISAVGATVTDGAGRLAAVSVPVPAQRFGGNEERLSRSLLAAWAAITAALSAAGPRRG
jgi:DNA-binding IclR family transcriptional regulator